MNVNSLYNSLDRLAKGFDQMAKLNAKESKRIEKESKHEQTVEILQFVADSMRKAGASEQSIRTAVQGTYEFLKVTFGERLEKSTEKIIKNPESLLEHDIQAPGILLSDVETQQVDWLWHARIPLGKITLLDGDPGMGKSLLAINIAACVSTGRSMPDDTPGRQGGIILIAPEDAAEDTIKPRLEAAGGDPSQVLLLNNVDCLDMIDTEIINLRERPFSLAHDLEVLERRIKDTKAILVVLDPLMAILGRSIDSSRDQDVREVLTPLAQIAERTGCAILIIRHLNKGSSDNILYRGAGSIGITAAARTCLLVAHDPDDEQKRVFATIKNNLSKMACNLTYQVVENERGAPYIQWLGENHYVTSALLRQGTSLSFERQEILRVLKEASTPLDAKEIAECTGLQYKLLRSILSRMQEAGVVTRPYRGKYTTPNHPALVTTRTVMSSDTSETSATTATTATTATKSVSDLPTSEE
jgi:archaellum biogenesis ATPase FlaH